MSTILSETNLELENLQQKIDITDRNVDVLSIQSLPETQINLDNSETKIQISGEQSDVDGRYKHTNFYATKRNVAEGMMDIALLTANANQLRFLITYNYDAKTFYVNMILIILSLVLQIAVGIALIFKRQMKNRGNLSKASQTNEFLVVGVFMVTIINVFVAAFTTTDSTAK